MKSIRRCQHVITIFLLIFIAGLTVLVIKINREAPFYMMHSDVRQLGKVYDRNGDVLFDGSDKQYEAGHFTDVGSLIGDDKGQMNNTLVARNIGLLNNYSFSSGTVSKGGKAAIYTTLDHAANRAVFDAYGDAKGCACAYNYKTGELLVCVSLPAVDLTQGYDGIDTWESGTLMSKPLYGTVPGSTQKVSTLISAFEIMGADKLYSKMYNCSGRFINAQGKSIDCHQTWGHGDQNIVEAVENSCNPYFAQLVQDPDMPLDRIAQAYTKLGYAINGAEPQYIDIDGIECEKASTTLTDSGDFTTQWGCIGQGDTLVSPIQLMMWQSAVANGTGKMTMPHLISKVTDVNGKDNGVRGTNYSQVLFKPSTALGVKQILMTNAADNYAASIPGHSIGIKSGTAQVKDGAEENALFVGFVDEPEHPIAFCVVLENKFGTPVAAENIVNTILNSLC